MIKVYDEITYPLFMIFHSSVSEGIFPEQLKVAKVSPVFEVGSIEEVGTYIKSISVLLIFSKVIERIMYNRTYQYFKENGMLFPKKFCFQINNSTHYSILNLIDNILTSFKKSQVTLGVLIDLSKAFGTDNYSILLYKLELYEIKGKSLNWSYSKHWQQFVSPDKIENNMYCKITCGVSQGSFLRPILFFLDINDLCRSSSKLIWIFADDTNLYISDSNTISLF